MLRLNTIYNAFMGEQNTYGIGVPCTFIRLAGCNLRCYWRTKGVKCDTPEALKMELGREISAEWIADYLSKHGKRIVCVTGGEPLMQDITELLVLLSDNGHKVVVETNGSKSIKPYRHIRNVSFVVDVKSSSSGESGKMAESNFPLLGKEDFVKFVIDTEEDYDEFEEWVTAHDRWGFNVAVGTYWGSKISYEQLMGKLSSHGWNMPVYLNIQAHKMCFLYDSFKDAEEFGKLIFPREL